jgi:alpha-ribazole phosphatase/probable phosphoglycerate mutase
MSKTPRSDRSHRVFLVRHGETDWNREFRYQGVSDIDLNQSGFEQARKLGLRLAKELPSRVFASPLLRALHTAETVMERNGSGAPVITDGDLCEISFGWWEGLSISEVGRRDPDTIAAWRERPFSVIPDGGETLEDVSRRASRAADTIKKGAREPGATLVVAHGAILRALLASLMNISDLSLMWRIRFDNCSVSVLDFWNLRPSLLLLNDTHHARMSDRDIAKLTFPSN